MEMEKKLKKLKKEYKNIPIPTELDCIVTKACKPRKKKKEFKYYFNKWIRYFIFNNHN
ncbi:hypothetical protein P4V72_05540 [Bacillus thuringiensis]|uniref:hypothetical protein n=1 Tax=Bacillus cereus group TaxID=86661 RepID=UPI0005B6AD8F|nr:MULTISPECIES: hypothetical protein [Bacillus cereus group]KIP25624.1 hypothetical protein BG10_4895 [Bacillus thuringiensis serovar morrisoni]MCT6943862.1 hypothetical protein [Bacillus thuringiensis]MEC3572197.1 hypothetical protein [Bacillus thuringiensis]MED2022515.1 hypothetical protein [Bacillus thuringiensis]MED2079850.1 hypothetical protein [Bacillus thuringiensis]